MVNEKQLFKGDYKYFLSRVKKARAIYNELKKYANLNHNKKIKVLAVGGKYGFIEYNLSKWTKWDITTSDIDKKSIKKYPILKKYVTIKVLDATKLPYKDNTFDLIIFNHVIEHLIQYKKAVKELYRVLKLNGYLYLATPNIRRKLVNPKVALAKKRGIADEKRISLHMGFSNNELESMLSIFSNTENITKRHQADNLGILGFIANILPQSIFKRYSQTHVFICRK